MSHAIPTAKGIDKLLRGELNDTETRIVLETLVNSGIIRLMPPQLQMMARVAVDSGYIVAHPWIMEN